MLLLFDFRVLVFVVRLLFVGCCSLFVVLHVDLLFVVLWFES